MLQRFPNRNTFFLYDNPIKAVKHEAPPEGLETLKCINISKVRCSKVNTAVFILSRESPGPRNLMTLFQTELTDRHSIDQLNMLPGLIDLRIMNVPLLEEYDEEDRHHLIISRLPNLLALNGSVITPGMRETAERFFIRYYQVGTKLAASTLRSNCRIGKTNPITTRTYWTSMDSWSGWSALISLRRIAVLSMSSARRLGSKPGSRSICRRPLVS